MTDNKHINIKIYVTSISGEMVTNGLMYKAAKRVVMCGWAPRVKTLHSVGRSLGEVAF